MKKTYAVLLLLSMSQLCMPLAESLAETEESMLPEVVTGEKSRVDAMLWQLKYGESSSAKATVSGFRLHNQQWIDSHRTSVNDLVRVLSDVSLTYEERLNTLRQMRSYFDKCSERDLLAGRRLESALELISSGNCSYYLNEPKEAVESYCFADEVLGDSPSGRDIGLTALKSNHFFAKRLAKSPLTSSQHANCVGRLKMNLETEGGIAWVLSGNRNCIFTDSMMPHPLAD